MIVDSPLDSAASERPWEPGDVGRVRPFVSVMSGVMADRQMWSISVMIEATAGGFDLDVAVTRPGVSWSGVAAGGVCWCRVVRR